MSLSTCNFNFQKRSVLSAIRLIWPKWPHLCRLSMPLMQGRASAAQPLPEQLEHLGH